MPINATNESLVWCLIFFPLSKAHILSEWVSQCVCVCVAVDKVMVASMDINVALACEHTVSAAKWASAMPFNRSMVPWLTDSDLFMIGKDEVKRWKPFLTLQTRVSYGIQGPVESMLWH